MRTRYAFYNLIVAGITSVILPLLGFVKVRLFVSHYGSDLNGLYLVMSQVIMYLNICEVAFSLAFRQLLFKPLAEDDRPTILNIYHGARKVFKTVGVIVLVAGVIAGLILPYFNDPIMSKTEMFVLFFILFVPFSISYFLMGPNFVIMADQKEYKINIWIQTIAILRMVLMIVIIVCNLPYLLIFLVEGAQVLIANTIAYFVAKKNYPWLDEKAENPDSKTFVNNSKFTLVHRLATIANNNTDSIVISAFLNLKLVSIYGAYSYLTEAVLKIVSSVITAPINSFGNLFNDKKADSYSVFTEFYSFSTYIGTIISSCILVAMNQFVLIWMNRDDYGLPILASVLFALNIYYLTQREPIIMARDTTGHFKESVGNAYLMSITKIVLSVILIQKYEIIGVLWATFLSYWIVDLFYNPKLVYDKVFTRTSLDYFKMFIIRLVIFFGVSGVLYAEWNALFGYISGGILHFLIGCMIVGITSVAMTTLIYSVSFKAFRNLFVRLIGLIKRK